MNILFVGAHNDDLELSMGGSVKKWIEQGHKVVRVTLTNSEWEGPKGERYGDKKIGELNCIEASKVLGVTPIFLNYCSELELKYSYQKVMDILNIISKYNIDTLITVWQHDAHTDHRVASKIALAASREIPRVLLTRVSWNSVPFAYKPNYFVDITSQFQSKLDTLKCYKDEFERTGDLWEKFISSQGKLYGLESGCDLAEGFEIVKWLE